MKNIVIHRGVTGDAGCDLVTGDDSKYLWHAWLTE